MALTKEEKELLDNEVLAYLQDIERRCNDNYYINYSEIISHVSIKCTTISILYSIERLFTKNLIHSNHFITENINHFGSHSQLTYYSACYITQTLRDIYCRKNKNIVVFECRNGNKIFSYDFISNKFDIDINKCKFCGESTKNFFTKVLDSKYEWMFNYCTDLGTISSIIDDYPTEALKMPSGLFERIQENGGVLSKRIFEYSLTKERFGKYYRYAVTMNLMELTKDEIVKIYKIQCLDMLETDGNYIRSLISRYKYTKNLNIEYILDTNRSSCYNLDQMDILINKEKNELLAKKLQRLNFIHNHQFSDYTVVVPQTQQDKIDEGRMQNNCVGHYYDDSIINGANLIFFLRKTNNKNKSYITCRYNIACAEVTEARKKNNMSIDNTYEESLIKEIGKIIKDNLK